MPKALNNREYSNVLFVDFRLNNQANKQQDMLSQTNIGFCFFWIKMQHLSKPQAPGANS